MSTRKNLLVLAVSTTLAAGLVACGGEDAAAEKLSAATAETAKVVEKAAGKEGKCGGDMAKEMEGKCGEGKCGGDMAKGTDKKMEGKCGEGKCGGDMAKGADKKMEGKCGEGKCGDMKK